MPDPTKDYAPQKPRQRFFNFRVEDWPLLVVVAPCGLVFLWQKTQETEGFDLAFSGQAMMQGQWWTLFTALFLHASIIHIASNMMSYLSLAPIVVARFGGGWKSLIPYHILYLACGLAGNLLFWAIHPHGEIPVLGASGAIYGIYAAAMRLDPYRSRVAPIFSQTTLNAIWTFLWSNAVVIALFGGVPMLLQVFSGKPLQIPIAWEAHLGGFITGFFLIGLMAGRAWPQWWLGDAARPPQVPPAAT